MSFDLDPTETNNILDVARRNPIQPGDLQAGFFEGAGTGLWNGLKSGDARIKAEAATEDNTDQMAQRYQHIKSLKPDNMSVGLAGQVLFGVAETSAVAYENFMGGSIVPTTLATDVAQTYKKTQTELNVLDGMDRATAEQTAKTEGAFQGLGLIMPAAVVGKALTRVVSGAAIQAGTGVAQRTLMSHELNTAGYPEMADQYKPFDTASLLTDLILGGGIGGAFGTRPNAHGVTIKPSDVDATLVMNQAAHMETGTAPGMPISPESRQAHVDAINKALDDILAGDPVDVGHTNITEAKFESNPSTEAARGELGNAIAEHLQRADGLFTDLESLKAQAAARGILFEDISRDAPSPVRYTQNLKSIIKQADAEGWDSQRILTEAQNIVNRLDDRNFQQSFPKDRVRGDLLIREKLINAERNGHISPESRKLAEWLLDKNPAIADDLGMSVRKGSGDGASGNYNPLNRVVTLIKNSSNDATAVHEILHHTERMMPEQVQQGIRKAWLKELQGVADHAANTQNHELAAAVHDALMSATGDKEARGRVLELIRSGKLPYEFYRFTNPSEYWAVNAARIIGDQANAETWVAKAREWLKEFVEKAKELFGLSSEAAIHRALQSVIAGDGKLSGNMIGEGDLFNNIAKKNGRSVGVEGAQAAKAMREAIAAEGGHEIREVIADQVVHDSQIPTITMRDLLGKKIFPTIADRTAAGFLFKGIDSTKLKMAIELLGGPFFPLRWSNIKAGVIWANRGKEVNTQKGNKVKDGADHMIVLMGDANMHQSNTTVANVFFSTLEAYVKDKRITKTNSKALTKLIKSSLTKDENVQSYIDKFPGMDDLATLEDYLHSLSFTARSRLLDILGSKSAQALGAPSMTRILDATREPSLAGHRWGDGALVLKIDNDKPFINLGEEGTRLHPDYPLGIRGEIVGRLEVPINYEVLWQDWIKDLSDKKLADNPDAKMNTRRAFELAKPAVEITQDLIDRIGPIRPMNIDSHRQAKLAVDMALDRWRTSDDAKNKGGASPQDFVDAVANSEAKVVLNEYTRPEVVQSVKDGKMRLFQLGDEKSGVWFALKKGNPGDDYGIEIKGLSENDITLTAVINNEQGARGIAGPAVMIKSLQEGATVLDAFSVKSDRFPDGFLPTLYNEFGFEEVGRIPFEPKYYSKLKLADAERFWRESSGWDKAKHGYPDVVIMKWRGTDADRSNITERYIQHGAQGIISKGDNPATEAILELASRDDRAQNAEGRSTSDTGGIAGDQGAGNRTSLASRARGVVGDISRLNDNEARNYGISVDDKNAIAAKYSTKDGLTAKSIAVENPDMMIPTEEGKTTTAQSALDQADENITTAKADSKAFDVAITCGLRG